MESIRKNALFVPFLVTLIASFIVVATFFLPLASANSEYKEHLEEYAQEVDIEKIGLSNEDIMHLSMYDFGKIYWAIYDTIDKALGVIAVAFIAATGIMSLITLLFTLCKKPIAVIIFNILTFIAYYMITWDFKDRGVMPNNRYDWGIAYYLYFIGIAVVFAGAIWMLVAKIQQKRRKAQES